MQSFLKLKTINMNQEHNDMDRKLQNKIVDRQIAVRQEEYEDVLRHTLSESSEDAHLKTTYIANFFSYCDYAKKNAGWIPFSKELDFLENYFLMEQLFFGDCFRLHRDCNFIDFAIPSFTVYPLIREIALNLVCCDRLAEIWVSTQKERDTFRIAIRHDVPEESLRDAYFRASNAYGFSLLQERIRQYGGSLTREALAEGLLEATLILPVKTSKDNGPVYLWY